MNIENEKQQILDFLNSDLASNKPIIITASEESKILDAYKHHIAAFLSKPFEEKVFNEVLDSAKKNGRLCTKNKKNEFIHFKEMIENGQINRIALTTLDGYVIVHYDEIIRCEANGNYTCLLYTSPSPRDKRQSRMPSSA